DAPLAPVLPLPSFYKAAHHRHLHSFPTRRSSDLQGAGALPARGGGGGPAAAPQHRAAVRGRRARRPADPGPAGRRRGAGPEMGSDRKSTRLNSSHVEISYAVFCLKKKKTRTLSSRHDISTLTPALSVIRPYASSATTMHAILSIAVAAIAMPYHTASMYATTIYIQ